LRNKMVFQAGVDPVGLGQSACNQHAYTVWLFGIPMILCSNDFQLKTRDDSPMLEVDEEYLENNIVDASLPEGVLWYVDQKDAESDGACQDFDSE